MDLRQLRYFVGVIETGSVSRAAIHLNVAQSAISQHVSRLEAELKSQLIIRGQRGVKATPSGQILYNHARKILRQIEIARDDVKSVENSPAGQVAVGFPPALSALLSHRLFEKVEAKFPRIKLKLIDGVSSHLKELLQNDRIDIALLFLSTSERGLHVQPLVVEELFYISSNTKMTRIALADIVKKPIMLPSRNSTITKVVEAALAEKMLSVQSLGEIDSMSALKQAAASGRAATILPWSALQGYEQSAKIGLAKISDAALSRCISLCMTGSSDWSHAALEVATVLAAMMQDLVKAKEWHGASLVSDG